MRRILASSVLLMTLVACASKPENIAPAYISETKYAEWNCSALATERGRYDDALAQASKQQRKARSNDTLGVVFLGLPVSTLAGNNAAGEIGRLKGEVEALARAQGQKNCFAAVSAKATSSAQSASPVSTMHSNFTKFGIEGAMVTSASAVGVHMPDPHGVLVRAIAPESLAANARLQKGDVIQSFNNIRVATPDDLDSFVTRAAPGTIANLGIWRDRQILEITIQL